MNFSQVIEYCPRCGSDSFPEKAPHFFLCEDCDFHFHINCTPGVVGIVADNAGGVLLIRRGKDPGKGKFSVPGGFVDSNETIEAALARELREEVNLEMVAAEYLSSYPNPYLYRGVVFPVVDLIFVCEVRTLETLSASDEVESFEFVDPAEIDLNEIAFPSIRHGLERYIQKRVSILTRQKEQ
ncbi:MAG: NUDIX domain-containing protein [Akkermansiaceae bacterium]|nr:NUDIX domain-containing protein [Armatimonadota bacterium]